MHEAVSGQRSRRPSLTPSARAARGFATSAAAAAAATPRRRMPRGFAAVLDAAVRVQLRNASHRWKQVTSCSTIQRCACLRMMTTTAQNWPAARVFLLLTWQAALLRLLGAARLPYNISRRRVLLRGQGERPKIKQEMLLHKIGAFWDGPGWTKHRRAVRRAVTVRLCRASFRHAVGRRHKL